MWLCLWCSLMKHTISLIWSVGEAIRYMTALPSSGFSGSTLRSQKLLLVILHQHTIDIDSVHSLFTSAILRVSKQHTQATCHMPKMVCCSTTSKILIPFIWTCSSKSCPHIYLLASFINWGFVTFFFLIRHAHYQAGITPLALVWKDETCSQYVIDTDSKGEIPSEQHVCLCLIVWVILYQLDHSLNKKKSRRHIKYWMVLTTVLYLILFYYLCFFMCYQVVLELLEDGKVVTSDDPPIVFCSLDSAFIQKVLLWNSSCFLYKWVIVTWNHSPQCFPMFISVYINFNLVFDSTFHMLLEAFDWWH